MDRSSQLFLHQVYYNTTGAARSLSTHGLLIDEVVLNTPSMVCAIAWLGPAYRPVVAYVSRAAPPVEVEWTAAGMEWSGIMHRCTYVLRPRINSEAPVRVTVSDRHQPGFNSGRVRGLRAIYTKITLLRKKSKD
jgi:hypothetical protein